MTPSEKIISVNGIKVNFWEDGLDNQRSLLLIHGGFGDAYSHWSVAMPMLAENYRVLAPDLPGFGKSDRLPDLKTTALLDWLQAFLNSQKCEQAVIIGNSFGGVVARLFTAAYPTQVPAVILVNGGAISDVPGALRTLEKIPGISNLLFYLFSSATTGSGTLKRMLHVQSVVTDDFRLKVQQSRSGFVRIMRMLVTSPVPDAQTPLVPTLILWGADDGFTPLDEANAIKESIAGSTLVEISECGHMPQLETPDVFVWQVDTFLTNLSRPAKSSRQGPQILSNPSG